MTGPQPNEQPDDLDTTPQTNTTSATPTTVASLTARRSDIGPGRRSNIVNISDGVTVPPGTLQGSLVRYPSPTPSQIQSISTVSLVQSNLRVMSTIASRRNAISQGHRHQQTGEERQAAARRRHEFAVRLEREAAQSERRCMTDADRICAEEDKEDEEELCGPVVELSYEGQLPLENEWM